MFDVVKQPQIEQDIEGIKTFRTRNVGTLD